MKETILQVDGMTCASCVRHVDHALRALEGVDEVEVHLGDGTVRVRHNPASAPVSTLVAELQTAGYSSRAPAA